MAENPSTGPTRPGNFDEKAPIHEPTKKEPPQDEEEDEDIDALIEDLESIDGNEVDDDDEGDPNQERPIAEEYLRTDRQIGLTESEVTARRKKFGPNQMKEEKENLLLKFVMFFYGPIQFVMEVSFMSLQSLCLLFFSYISHHDRCFFFPPFSSHNASSNAIGSKNG